MIDSDLQEFTPELYEKTFEEIARRNKKILHAPEQRRVRFLYEKVYDSASKMAANIPKDAPCLLLDLPVHNLKLNPEKEVTASNRVAFSVVRHVANRTDANEVLTVNEMYLLMCKILGKLKEMYEDNDIKYNFDFEAPQCTPIGPIFDNCFGWRFEFDWNQKLQNLTEVDENDWDF